MVGSACHFPDATIEPQQKPLRHREDGAPARPAQPRTMRATGRVQPEQHAPGREGGNAPQNIDQCAPLNAERPGNVSQTVAGEYQLLACGHTTSQQSANDRPASARPTTPADTQPANAQPNRDQQATAPTPAHVQPNRPRVIITCCACGTTTSQHQRNDRPASGAPRQQPPIRSGQCAA